MPTVVTPPLRVVSVPSAHPYVGHLGLTGPDLVLLPDVPDPVTGQWWPPAQVDAGWVRAHAGEFDVVHVHFGIEALEPARLHGFVAALAELGVPLFVTVHDVDNPHLPPTPQARDRYGRQLGILLRAAAEVFTLTPGAAAEVRARWGREATVVPHPQVVPSARITDPQRRPGHRPVVGVHLKDLRANVAARPVVAALVEGLGTAVTIRVALHAARAGEDVGRALAAFAAAGSIELVLHERLTDDELWDALRALDVCVLPYAWGSHSGWLEACWDLGTAVVAPDCGFYAEQQAVQTYLPPTPTAAAPELAASLAAAVRRALAVEPEPAELRRRRRATRRTALAASHRRAYGTAARTERAA